MNKSEPSPGTWASDHEGHHANLHKMCAIDTSNNTRITPNGEPFPITNDTFVGHVYLLVRTPDVDSAKEPKPSLPSAQAVSKYLKGRQRRFEFQFQFKLKKVPTGPLFLGCEGEKPVKLGRVSKGLCSFLLAMIGRINSGFHYSWGITKDTTEEQIENGNYEKIHLAFPVEASMDRIIVSKPGEPTPTLGEELFETEESVKNRRKKGAGTVQWNTEDTYTMCLWSAYMDWIQWRCMNVPGIRPFSLSVVTGTQPIYLCVYEIKGVANEEYKKKKPPHLRKQIDIFCRLEMSHIDRTEGAISDKILSGHNPVKEVDITESSVNDLNKTLDAETSSSSSSVSSLNEKASQ
eukprot:CAMPEP_0194210348 /NCGR_PEP_ID=MMETSP0156-20130528/8168_1 /TAXON_ID=33649 /ORGANISM="Thalassionema nitzschioides, Strain L26-B" /LENGTH=347 /DNA_ID=CAMNT_0038937679 /DNA_START=151 /DNA_END=1194 /DNA_ORIENTATION=-